jgi:hypothetical protein
MPINWSTQLVDLIRYGFIDGFFSKHQEGEIVKGLIEFAVEEIISTRKVITVVALSFKIQYL